MFGHNFDINAKIGLDNYEEKRNSKIVFEFQYSTETKMKIWVLFSIFWKIENRRTDPFLWVV